MVEAIVLVFINYWRAYGSARQTPIPVCWEVPHVTQKENDDDRSAWGGPRR